MIARNFSKRNLCLNPIPQHEELSLFNHNIKACNSQLQIGKPLRWFESGSVGSIHLGSSLEIFKEPEIPANFTTNQQKSSILAPWRKQSQNLIHAFRLQSARLSHQFISNDEPVKEIKVTSSVPDKLDIMLEDDEYISPTDLPPQTQPTGCCTIFRWFVQFFDLDLLRDNIYLNIMIGMAIAIFAETNFAVLTPFILSDLNFNSDEIAIILFVMAIADLISRFCSPFIADKLNLSIRVSFLISLILLVLTRMCKFIAIDLMILPKNAIRIPKTTPI